MNGGQPEERLEGGHRGAASVEAEGELVEVDLEMGVADAVVGPDEPSLEVPEDPVNARQQLLRAVRRSLKAGAGAGAQRAERGVGLPSAGDRSPCEASVTMRARGATTARTNPVRERLDASRTTWSRTRPDARPRISTAPATSTLSSSCRPPRNPTSGPPM